MKWMSLNQTLKKTMNPTITCDDLTFNKQNSIALETTSFHCRQNALTFAKIILTDTSQLHKSSRTTVRWASSR